MSVILVNHFFGVMMKLNCIALLCGLFLTGCQNTQTLNLSTPSVDTVSSIQQLDIQSLPLPSSTNIIISSATQKINSDDIQSPAINIALPINQGPLSIELTSKIKDSVFSPIAVIYDENQKIIQTIQSSDFNYVKPRLSKGNRLVAEISFFPSNTISAANLVIYTTQDELQKKTEIIHPARLDAEARGNYFPEAKDIPMPHTLTGELVIDIEPYTSHSFFGSDSKENNTPKESLKVNDETVQYYSHNIQKAVSEDNIPKALSLLEEAKALHIDGAEEIFVNAINSK